MLVVYPLGIIHTIHDVSHLLYRLLIAVEKELHCVPTETRLKWFEREIRQENKGLFGERIVALSKFAVEICHLIGILVFYRLNDGDTFICYSFTDILRSE